jgi:hypothetical protein
MWFLDEGPLAFLEVNEAAIRHYGYTRDEDYDMRTSACRRRSPVLDHGHQSPATPGTRVGPPDMWRRTQDSTVVDVTSSGPQFGAPSWPRHSL